MRTWGFWVLALLAVAVSLFLPISVASFLDPALDHFYPSNVVGTTFPLFLVLATLAVRQFFKRKVASWEYWILGCCMVAWVITMWLHMFTTVREIFAVIHLLLVLVVLASSGRKLWSSTNKTGQG